MNTLPGNTHAGVALKTKNKEIFVRYLLGDLPEDERERLEKEYFADHETLQFLHCVEDDLIDAYVRGDLLLEQRKQFERYFLDSPLKQRRVEFARTLWLALSDQEKPAAQGKTARVTAWRSSATWRVLAATLLVVLVLLTFLTIQNWRLRTALSQAQSARLELQNQIRQLQQESAVLAAEPKLGADWPLSARGETISMLLVPSLLRDGGDSKRQRLFIPPDASSVFLVLQLPADRGPLYRAVLQTAEGTLAHSFDALRSRALPGGGQAVVLNLTPQTLNRGDYVIRLFAQTDQGHMEELHPYSFSVTR